MSNLYKEIEQAQTPVEVIDLQIKVQQSLLSREEKAPLLKLLDAQLALVKARIELGDAYVVCDDTATVA
jgi:hypothetical protein